MNLQDLEKLISSLISENLNDEKIKDNTFRDDFLKWWLEIDRMSRIGSCRLAALQMRKKYSDLLLDALKRRFNFLRKEQTKRNLTDEEQEEFNQLDRWLD